MKADDRLVKCSKRIEGEEKDIGGVRGGKNTCSARAPHPLLLPRLKRPPNVSNVPVPAVASELAALPIEKPEQTLAGSCEHKA